MKISLLNSGSLLDWVASLLLTTVFFSAATSNAQSTDDCIDSLQCESSWIGMSDSDRETVFAFAEDYKAFIHEARTELSFVAEAVAFAVQNGFEELTDSTDIVPGKKIYEVNRDRTISLLVIGEEAIQDGFHIIGSHIDSPRLELKGRPLFEASEFALFQTNYHGGIKYHQWTNLPLALIGRIDKKDGTSIQVLEDLYFRIPIIPFFRLLASYFIYSLAHWGGMR